MDGHNCNDLLANDNSNLPWPPPLDDILKELSLTIDEETRKRNFERNTGYSCLYKSFLLNE